jgi:hypothetical protein
MNHQFNLVNVNVPTITAKQLFIDEYISKNYIRNCSNNLYVTYLVSEASLAWRRLPSFKKKRYEAESKASALPVLI